MGNLINLLQAGTIQYPSNGSGWLPFIGKFFYNLIHMVDFGGAIGFGLAIVFATLILKLILLPLDFGNRYFTKKNSNQMAKIKPEEDALKEQYASDPMALNRARQELYKKHNYKMGGFCLFTIVNLVLTLAIFMSVFMSLQSLANYNTNYQYKEYLQPIYISYEQEYDLFAENAEDVLGEDRYAELMAEFSKDVNDKYEETRVGFLWVNNIWKPDTMAGKTYDLSSFNSATKNVEGSVFSYEEVLKYYDMTQEQWDELSEGTRVDNENAYLKVMETRYNAIFAEIAPNYKGWNGWFILVILAGASNYLSATLNNRIMSAQQKKKNENKKDAVAQYSMRNVKNQADAPQMPSVDPQMMGKVMKFMLPIIAVIFTFMYTTSLALYFIASSIISTLLTIVMRYPVDWLLKWQEKRREKKDEQTGQKVDPTIINPHAKYFKNRPKR